MKILKDVKELLSDTVKEIYNKGNLTPTDIEVINKSVEAIKFIEEICAMNDEYEDGYSGCNYSRRSMNYDGGYSGRRNGRYSSYGYDNRNYDRRYSGENGNPRMIEKLEDLMESATNNHERDIIKSCIEKLS